MVGRLKPIETVYNRNIPISGVKPRNMAAPASIYRNNHRRLIGERDEHGRNKGGKLGKYTVDRRTRHIQNSQENLPLPPINDTDPSIRSPQSTSNRNSSHDREAAAVEMLKQIEEILSEQNEQVGDEEEQEIEVGKNLKVMKDRCLPFLSTSPASTTKRGKRRRLNAILNSPAYSHFSFRFNTDDQLPSSKQRL